MRRDCQIEQSDVTDDRSYFEDANSYEFIQGKTYKNVRLVPNLMKTNLTKTYNIV